MITTIIYKRYILGLMVLGSLLGGLLIKGIFYFLEAKSIYFSPFIHGVAFISWSVGLCLGLILFRKWFLYTLADLAKWMTVKGKEQRLPLLTSYSKKEVIAFIASLSELKNQSEASLHRYNMEHQEKEVVLNHLNDAVFVLSKQLTFIWANEATKVVFDLPVTAQLDQKNLAEIVRNSALISKVKQCITNMQEVAGKITLTMDVDKIVSARITPLPEWGTPSFLVILKDITHIERLEKIRQEFVSNVSHELKTPLTLILGGVESLESLTTLTDEQVPWTTMIKSHGQRLHAIVNDLLLLSKLDQTKKSIVTEDIQISALLNRVKDKVLSYSLEKPLDFQIKCSDEIKVAVNPPLFEEVIQNLVDNSIKYSKDSVSIAIKVEDTPTDTRFEISDKGIGISTEHQSRIFERFYCVDDARSKELGGTGLGLSIVKHIVLRHGGTISVESQMGKGTLFKICIPKR